MLQKRLRFHLKFLQCSHWYFSFLWCHSLDNLKMRHECTLWFSKKPKKKNQSRTSAFHNKNNECSSIFWFKSMLTTSCKQCSPEVKLQLTTGGLFYVYLIKRDVLSHHAAQAVDEGREGDGTWSVAVAPNLSSRPCEVKHCTALWWRFLKVLSHIHSDKKKLNNFSFSLLTSSSLIWTRSLIGVPSSMKSSDSTSKDPVWCRLRRAKSLSMSLTASSALLWNTNTEAAAQKN